MLKILILTAYYERPNIVKNALYSLKNQDYLNWELVFVDDGSIKKARAVVESVLGEHLDKVKIWETKDSISLKIVRGGSIFGSLWNKGIMESNADLAIMLCDDDALYPNYLSNLNKWFSKNINKVWCHSHVKWYDPFSEKDFRNIREKPFPAYTKKFFTTLNYTEDINPFNTVDASQVAWRIKCNHQKNIWFPSPQTRNHDASLYSQMFHYYGACSYSGFKSQFKAICPHNMQQRLMDYSGVVDLPDDHMPIF